MLNAKQQKALKPLTLIRPCPDIYRQGVRDFGLSFPFVLCFGFNFCLLSPLQSVPFAKIAHRAIF
jgi:hypothetical protein